MEVGTSHPAFAWTLLSSQRNARNQRQRAYQILVATSLTQLTRNNNLVWDSGQVPERTYWQRPYGGPALQTHTTYYWKVRVWNETKRVGAWSDVAHFTTAMLSPGDWAAHWIAAAPDSLAHERSREGEGVVQAFEPPPLPVFRRDVVIGKPLDSAVLSIAGLGQYEVRLNGHNVTDTVMNPGWTDYRKTVLYNSYDVTRLLRGSSNSIAVLLGNGMYNVEGVKGRYTKFIGSFGQPKCLLQLDLRYMDGTSARFISDTSWKTHAGPVLYSSIYGGETYDARALPEGWDQPGFHDSDWHGAIEVAGPGGKLVAQSAPPMIVAETYPSLRTTTPRPGVTVYDLGANMSGWPSLVVHGSAGARVDLLAGELLNSDGTVSQRSAAATPADPVLFSYVLSGNGVETWHPRFSYYSFRYVQVTTSAPGAHVPPQIVSLAGEFVHARAAQAGTFDSANPLFNNIHRLIDRAVLSNLASIITDCPSREKLGWLEQTYLNASTLMLNYDVTGLYEKLSSDMLDAQLPNGLVPSIAPEFVQFVDRAGHSTAFRDSPEWGSAVILSPWALFRYSGDTQALAESYEGMKRYIAYLQSRTSGGLLDYGLGDWYDIGPKPPGPSQLTSRTVTATGVYYEDLQALAQIAALLGHPADAAGYTRLASDVRTAYNAALFHPGTNLYDRGSQTAQAIPLALGLVPQDKVQLVLDHLVADIHAHHDHVTAGDIGFHYIVRALTDNGRSDVLAAMLSRTDSPSYGYQLARGATTLTEAWDANPESSQNHFMLGHGEEWFYRGLAGLSIDMAKGPDHALDFHPSLLESVGAASASFHSVMGLTSISWKRSNDAATVELVIPAGAQAHLTLPPAAGWRENTPASKDLSPNATGEIKLGSGTYQFTARHLFRNGASDPH